MDDCLFCQIAAKKIKTTIFFEDQTVIVIHDIKPKADLHLLIIPKAHFPPLNEVPEKEGLILAKLLLTAKKVAKMAKVESKGFRLIINNGPEAGQEVAHLHLHLLAGHIPGF